MPDESSEEDEDEEDELEEEEDEADGSYRLGARERALSPGLEESGLGLLARFAASALPSPTVGPSLSVVQLEAKQKARKKEERQSLMGKCCQVCFRQVAALPQPAGEETGSEKGRGRAGSRPRPEQRVGDMGPGLLCPRRGLQGCAVTFKNGLTHLPLQGPMSGCSGKQRPLICTPGGCRSPKEAPDPAWGAGGPLRVGDTQADP